MRPAFCPAGPRSLAGFCILTAIVFHRAFGDPDQVIHFLKNVMIAG
ncbi:MAG: hypothetical protein M3453_14740 [Pseudomonadota bacterium]|nr:hypothetical protein [Pseudomonadota bacterium]